LGALYGAFLHGLPSPLPDVPMQYADFADWQRDSLREELLQNELAYWRRQLGGQLPAPSLPTDRPRAGGAAARGRRCAAASCPGPGSDETRS
ncbi:MAG: hypothetical protein H0V05_06265, partial [Euzebyaceae bacterium]|nr:hypothetical protein [Euzebyaceae bacterium]